MVLSFLDKMEEWLEPVREFIFENHGNPVFWVIIIVIAIVTFFMVYSSLNKGQQ